MTMKTLIPCAVIIGILSAVACADEKTQQRADNWPQWRGPLQTGVAPSGNPPLKWSEEENVAWKVELPGLGNASPIVWGDQIFILTAIDTGKKGKLTAKPASAQVERDRPERQRGEGGRRRRGPGGRGRGRGRGGDDAPTTIHDFVVMSINRHTGDVIWQKTARSQVPHEGFRPGDNSFASASPVSQVVYHAMPASPGASGDWPI